MTIKLGFITGGLPQALSATTFKQDQETKASYLLAHHNLGHLINYYNSAEVKLWIIPVFSRFPTASPSPCPYIIVISCTYKFSQWLLDRNRGTFIDILNMSLL